MFEQSFTTRYSSAATAKSMTASLALQCAIVLAIALFCTLRPQRLPLWPQKTRLLIPIPPPRPIQLHSLIVEKSGPRSLTFEHPRPAFVFQPRAPVQTAMPPEPFLSNAPVIAEQELTGDSMGRIFSPANKPLQSPGFAHPKAAAATSGPEKISAGVAEANLIEKVVPKYPYAAVITHLQGSVHFRAIIGVDGRIENLQVLEGPPLLINAARQAVLSWRYRPTLLSGKPVPVVTDITVNFKLSN